MQFLPPVLPLGSKDFFSLKLVQSLAISFVLLILLPPVALAACSPYMGSATINEINKKKANGNDSAADFVEIKVLDNTIPVSEYSSWTLSIQENGGQGPADFLLANFDELSLPWLVQKGFDIAIYIDLDAGMNVLLKDSSGNIIDYLDYDTSDSFAPLADGSCTAFVFDTTIASSSGGVKRIGRLPDGIGDWDIVLAQSEDPTEDTTNDDVPASAPDITVDNALVVPGADAVFVINLSMPSATDIVITFATQDETAYAGSDYTGSFSTLIIPAGSLSGEIVVSTRGTALEGESFKLLLSSSDAVVLSSLARATFTTPVAIGLDHFLISHDGDGINCVAEIMTISAIDSLGAVATGYMDQITLDTQSGKGSWALVSGNGTLVDAMPNDGLAVYTFDTLDLGTVSLALSYQEGAAVLDIDTYQSSNTLLRDNDVEGSLVFKPSGFTFTQSLLPNPPPSSINDPIADHIAATLFDIHLSAYGQTPSDPVCGVIEAYTGDKPLSFWFDYENPASGTLKPLIESSPIAVSEALASSQLIAFTAGQALVTMKYKDVGLIQLHAKEGGIYGASNTFVSKPADLLIVDIKTTSGTNNPIASTAAGPGFVKAGEAFTIFVEARDAEGSLTPNYSLESPGEGIFLKAVALVMPVGGINGSLNLGTISNGTNFAPVLPAGTFFGNTFSWDEYGIITLQASIADGDYLGSGDVAGTVSENVGRFYPASFALQSSALSAACNSVTYMGEPGLSINYSLKALGLGGNTLSNYDLPLVGVSDLATPLIHAENENNGIDLGGRLLLNTPIWDHGSYSLASSSGVFTRAAIADGPFESLLVSMSVLDVLDGLTMVNPNTQPTTATDCIALADCNAIALDLATQLRYGRLEVQNSYGPETEALDIAMRISYYDTDGSFTVNVDDDCTSYINSDASLSNYQDGLPPVTVISPSVTRYLLNGETPVIDALMLSAPAAGGTGSVDLSYDAPAWLEYNWRGAGNEDPSGTGSFGHFRGHDRVVYWREVFD